MTSRAGCRSFVDVLPASNAAFAVAFAPLIEVSQRGVTRPATPADLLELLEPPRYVLKRDRHYLADDTGWVLRQKDALTLNSVEDAREARLVGLREFGIETTVIRIRRRGTVGVESYRLRPDIKVSEEVSGFLGIGVSDPDAMHILATLSGGSGKTGEA